MQDAEFQKHLLATFRVEADEHLAGITSGLIDLEKAEGAEERGAIVETVFREAHSLKGAARSVGRGDIESVCQAMESLFSALKRGEVQITSDLLDLMQRGADFVAKLLTMLEGDRSDTEKASQRVLVRELSAASKGEGGEPQARATASGADYKGVEGSAPTPDIPSRSPQPPSSTAAEPPSPTGTEPPFPREGRPPSQTAGGPPFSSAVTPPSSSAGASPTSPPGPPEPPANPERRAAPHAATAESVRVSWSKLSAVLLLSEEMLSAKVSARQHALQMREMRSAFAAWRKEWARILPDLQRITPFSHGDEGEGHARELAKVLEFLSWNSAFIKSLEGRYASEAKRAEHDSRSLGGMIDNLLADMKKAMMFPFSSLLDAFPKIVRDLAKDRGKEVDLLIKGEEIEIDRRILEEMKDPLIHLVRNAVDHGIEKPEERESKRKSRRGSVTIRIAPRDDKAEIVVSDDGGGISPALVRSALLKLGVLSPERSQILPDSELLPYVFQSGVSTSPIITEVSGHGLGLAIVKEKVEKLGGTVSLESVPDAGTTFRMLLPLSVATFRGILVRLSNRDFVIPATHVERAVRLRREQIKTVENRETVDLAGVAVALERLETPLELPAPALPASGLLQAVVATAGEQRIAFVVDEVLGEQEVLLKGLGPQLSRVRNIAGATVLGSGVAPILNVPDLMKSASKRRGAPAAFAPSAPAESQPSRRRRVLVVEDSITSRTLLKNILESGGFEVSSAVDGVDGFTQLKSGEFDLVVSDVEMPRMNGFELTARIRNDSRLSELPVVLVTALATAEDREKGIDVGANAYIVKSSFDQSNLLEVVRRLC